MQLLSQAGGNIVNRMPDIWIAQSELECEGLDEETMILSVGRTFILPGSDYSKYLLELLGEINDSMDPVKLAKYATALLALSINGPVPSPAEFVRQHLALMSRTSGMTFNLIEDPQLVAVLGSTTFKSFNPHAWSRA